MEFLAGLFVAFLIYLGFKALETMKNLDKAIDSLKHDFEVLKTERDYYKEQYETLKKWEDWLPTDIAENGAPYKVEPKPREEVFSGEKKYDPNKVKGQFDSFFGYQPNEEKEGTPPKEE